MSTWYWVPLSSEYFVFFVAFTIVIICQMFKGMKCTFKKIETYWSYDFWIIYSWLGLKLLGIMVCVCVKAIVAPTIYIVIYFVAKKYWNWIFETSSNFSMRILNLSFLHFYVNIAFLVCGTFNSHLQISFYGVIFATLVAYNIVYLVPR